MLTVVATLGAGLSAGVIASTAISGRAGGSRGPPTEPPLAHDRSISTKNVPGAHPVTVPVRPTTSVTAARIATSVSGGSAPAPTAATPRLSDPKALGQLIVTSFTGVSATGSILSAIEAGQVGGIILFADNTAGGVGATRVLVQQLQTAARDGGNPGLLIMTDQEGGEVKRLPGPPDRPAAQMSALAVAATEGAETAALLRAAGVNVDLAPVADVAGVDGFMEQEQRTFGTQPAVVASAACAFARALRAGGVAYTLKHFPGLGDAYTSTDSGPVEITESAAGIRADDLAYRRCGAGDRALVMISSASYDNLTGSTPAVLSPNLYTSVLPADGVTAITISDDFQTAAITSQPTPALRAITAGLDLVVYPESEAGAESAYEGLLVDLRDGALSPQRVQSAATRVLALKRSLGLR